MEASCMYGHIHIHTFKFFFLYIMLVARDAQGSWGTVDLWRFDILFNTSLKGFLFLMSAELKK